MSLSSKIRVAVLRGGPSSEYDTSLKSGGHVLSLLREFPEKYEPFDIFISKDGEWHKEGLVREPQRIIRHADVVWNALHGSYGEDGEVQKILESYKVPFTGPGTLGAALSMNKDMAKDIYANYGLLTPKHELLDGSATPDQLIYIFRNYLHPVIVKPVTGSSSVGIRLANTFPELQEAIIFALRHAEQVIVEEFIRGKEGTCGVVENTRGERLYALLPVEIRGKEEIYPGRFKHAEKDLIADMAKRAHDALGLRHYSRSDFMITPSGKVYILETNPLPGFHEESIMPKSLHSVGWHPKDFVDHVIELAIG